MAGGRYPGSRVIPPRLPVEAMLPSGSRPPVGGRVRRTLPVTVAGPRRILTGFPSTDRGAESIAGAGVRRALPCGGARRRRRHPRRHGRGRVRCAARARTPRRSPTACCGSASGRSSPSSRSSTSRASSRRPMSAPASRSPTSDWRPRWRSRGCSRAGRCASRDTRAARSCARRSTRTRASWACRSRPRCSGATRCPRRSPTTSSCPRRGCWWSRSRSAPPIAHERTPSARTCACSSRATPRCTRWWPACLPRTRSRPTLGGGRRERARRRDGAARLLRAGRLRDRGRRRARFPPALTRPVVAAVIVKLTVPVAVVAACAALIHDVPDAFLVQAAMPTGLNACCWSPPTASTGRSSRERSCTRPRRRSCGAWSPPPSDVTVALR